MFTANVLTGFIANTMRNHGNPVNKLVLNTRGGIRVAEVFWTRRININKNSTQCHSFSKENMHGKRRQYAFVFLYCYCRKTFSEQRWAIKHVILCDKTSRFMRKYWPADSGISELLVIAHRGTEPATPMNPPPTLRIIFIMTFDTYNNWVECALLLGHPIYMKFKGAIAYCGGTADVHYIRRCYLYTMFLVF